MYYVYESKVMFPFMCNMHCVMMKSRELAYPSPQTFIAYNKRIHSPHPLEVYSMFHSSIKSTPCFLFTCNFVPTGNPHPFLSFHSSSLITTILLSTIWECTLVRRLKYSLSVWFIRANITALRSIQSCHKSWDFILLKGCMVFYCGHISNHPLGL